MTKKTQQDESGFTLVELLVVITIISVLAAIAMPVYMSQRTKGFKAQMSVDLRTVKTAETAYSAGNNGAYTTDFTALKSEGFSGTNGITTHVKLVANDYVACTKSVNVTNWLVYSTATGSTTSSPTDCA